MTNPQNAPMRKTKSTLEELRQKVIATRQKISEGMKTEEAAIACGFRNAQAYYDTAYRMGMSKPRQPAENDVQPVQPLKRSTKPSAKSARTNAISPEDLTPPENVDTEYPVNLPQIMAATPPAAPEPSRLRTAALEGVLLGYKLDPDNKVRLYQVPGGLCLDELRGDKAYAPETLARLADELQAVAKALQK